MTRNKKQIDKYEIDFHSGPEGFEGETWQVGDAILDDTDMFLMAILQDPVLSPEFCWENPSNAEYSGCYRVRDYQVKFNRANDQYAGFSCARSVGKTEREIIYGFIHFFRRFRQNLLITAPELLHLKPLAKQIEDRIERCRLTRENLRRDKAGSTGFSHNPFGVEYHDGTNIVGRIPQRDGKGVKGQHNPDLIIEEAQDYPDEGWTEVNERLSLEELVLTPNGFTEMRNISVGDFVIGSSGKPIQVLAESNIEDREVFVVELNDGTEIRCDAGHLWTVMCNRHRKKGRWRTITTKEISDHIEKGYGFGSVKQPWCLPRLSSPVEFSKKEHLPINPYLLGLIIGDGSTVCNRIHFSSSDQQLIDSFNSLISPEEKLVHIGRYDYRLAWRKSRSGGRMPTSKALLSLGLIGKKSYEKFIPREYLHSTVDDRVALLQGLVDTDGHVSKRNGLVSFCTSSKVLSDDVYHLVLSLGGKASRSVNKSNRGHRDMFIIRFRLHGIDPCRLERKLKNYRQSTVDKFQRKIIGVKSLGYSEKMKCIQVDSEDGLFVTRNFAITHNTVDRTVPDFTMHFYGVHRGARGGGFARRVTGGLFKIHTLTAIQRPGWGPAEKAAAVDAYGGVNSSDYRRNILGEPGAASSPIFVTARLMASVDQDMESHYNKNVYVAQTLSWEDLSDQGLLIEDVIDLPHGLKSDRILVGADLGLTESPTVCSIFAEINHKGKGERTARKRLALIRRFTLYRFRSRDIRQFFFNVWCWEQKMKGIGVDITGLGFPLFQEIEDSEAYPQEFKNAVKGWKFNEKIEVASEDLVSSPEPGVIFNPNPEKEVTRMTVIEATTKNLREWVDSGQLLLPMDNEVVEDLLAENIQRVKDVSRLTGSRKPNRFHILDSFRMASLIDREDGTIGGDVPAMAPVLDQVVDMGFM